MKHLKSIAISILFLVILLGSMQTFQSCEWILPDEKENDTIIIDPYPCDTCMVVYKPNIYLYPEVGTELEVSLDFPLGGSVIASIPEYGNGWSVFVQTDGTIDDEFSFLFYESTQPNIWQTDSGWCVSTENLETFFRENLDAYGFRDKEVEDYIEYWIPRLTSAAYYLIYPQGSAIIDEVIELNISEQPDQVQRLFYLIQGTNNARQLDEPKVTTDFKREGFFVLEWGVLMPAFAEAMADAVESAS